MTFDTEMVVTHSGQRTPTGRTLKKSLRKGDTCRNGILPHLLNSKVLVYLNILLIYGIGLDLTRQNTRTAKSNNEQNNM
jgi:hypothetical protein